mmetsp:Transcript_40098/g.39685  ORF Transcript_40098/g.39685 Transcript_40098/m.39685 type:complete len:92 (+) Transcript_40098:54-329(+)
MHISNYTKSIAKEDSSSTIKSPKEDSESSEYRKLMKKAKFNTSKQKKTKPFTMKNTSKPRQIYSELNSVKARKKKIVMKKKTKHSSVGNEE